VTNRVIRGTKGLFLKELWGGQRRQRCSLYRASQLKHRKTSLGRRQTIGVRGPTHETKGEEKNETNRTRGSVRIKGLTYKGIVTQREGAIHKQWFCRGPVRVRQQKTKKNT